MTDETGFESDVSRLLQLAGPRLPVPAAVTARVHGAVHAQWRQHLAARRRRRAWGLAALAAAACLAATLAIGFARRPALPVPKTTPSVAVLERAVGAGVRQGEGAGSAPSIRTGAGVPMGSWLETPAAGRAALRTIGGVSLRMDTDTRLQVLSTSSVWLERGAVYVDSDSRARVAPLEIHTREGQVRELGTQFQVRSTTSGVKVRVREGSVFLLDGDVRHEARAGTQLDAAGGRVAKSVAPVHGPDWTWVEEAAPEFSLEGRPLAAFLQWAARETGLSIRFEDDSLARSAGRTLLHGSTRGLTPSEALEAVLPTCGLALRREGGTAWIGRVRTRMGK